MFSYLAVTLNTEISTQLGRVEVGFVAVQCTIVFGMPSYNNSTRTKGTVAFAFIVHLWVIHIAVGMKVSHFTAVVFAVANRVPASLLAGRTLAGTYSFDVGGKIKSEVHFGHSLDQLWLSKERTT